MTYTYVPYTTMKNKKQIFFRNTNILIQTWQLYECEDEINFIVEVFLIRPFVRFVRVKSFTNEEQIKIKFGLF